MFFSLDLELKFQTKSIKIFSIYFSHNFLLTLKIVSNCYGMLLLSKNIIVPNSNIFNNKIIYSPQVQKCVNFKSLYIIISLIICLLKLMMVHIKTHQFLYIFAKYNIIHIHKHQCLFRPSK